jgi:hypothetical protein
MHALSAIPTSAGRGLCPPQRRGMRAIARQVTVELTPQTIVQIADCVVQRLQRAQQNQEQGLTRQELGMLTVAKLAKHLDLNPAWVYEHADELGAIRIGDGPKARIRFDLHTAKAALAQHQANRTPPPADVAPRRPRQRPATDLYSPEAPPLESRPRRILGARASLTRRPVRMRCI